MEPAVAVVVPGPSPVAARPPFTVGRVLGRSFSIWGQNAAAFTVLVLVLHAPVLVLSFVAGAPPQDGQSPGAMYLIVGGLNALLSMLLVTISAGALTSGVLQSLNGQRPGAGELLGFGVRSFGRVFLVSLNAGLRVVLWSLLLVVPGVMALCRMFVAVPVCVAEPGLSSSDAVARSGVLTKGKRGHIFAAVLVLWVVAFTVNMLVAVVGLRRGVVPFPVAAVVTWAVGAIVNSLWATAAGVAYHDLRLEKEGADTAQLAAVFE